MKPLIIAATLFPVAVNAQATRTLDAHEHGSGTLGIAISGSELAISLEAPGADIVGFEYDATSAEDRAAVDTAVSDLAHPLNLFVLPDDAGCSVTEARVSLVGEEHDEDHHDKHEHAGEKDHDDHHDEAHDEHGEDKHDEHGHDQAHDEHGEDEHDEAQHTEFRAEYHLTCQNPERIGQIEFAYFERFENALELDVQVVTDKGAKAYEVERDAPSLDLKGMF